MKDITGNKYNYLVAIKPDGKNKESRVRWLCECVCGNKTHAYKNQLESNQKKSCGCKIPDSFKTHGMRYHELYSVWSSMINRCESKVNDNYHSYGGRGIKVCRRWHDVNNFIKDMGDRPKGTSIDRIEVNGNYEKSNCRWATKKQQSLNKRDTVYLEYNGLKKPLMEWAEIMGIKRSTMYMRYRRGYSIEETINGKQ